MNKLKTYLWAGFIAGSTLLSSCSSDKSINEKKIPVEIISYTQENIKSVLVIDSDIAEYYWEWDTVFVEKSIISKDSKWKLSNRIENYSNGAFSKNVKKAVILSSSSNKKNNMEDNKTKEIGRFTQEELEQFLWLWEWTVL